ncbi:hypothetical protein G6F56_003522 [Rhizopus delemar]|uniref:Uncharacterized protein n=1 Tax=Rhizopus stolonifer TaxID=4846 RepID=A0A367IXH4_RHIST|nr:hypothetical protein G6F56_003522 [Rhizopus delemar]RCH82181.1 hypothetical protein CU098_006706 [Rhizopus stolonifer]
MDKNKPDIEKTPSTNKIILDYLLYLSIQSRLKQASIELLELSFPLPKEQETLLERKKRWIESATRAEQDKNAVESVVTGILSHHCHKPLDFKHDCHFEQRLHVCQLTNLVFGRFDAKGHVQRRRHRHRTHDIQDNLFSEPIQPAFCRRHRVQGCFGCSLPALTHAPTGLIEAIPTFMRTSADMLRRMLEKEEVKPMSFAGQKVMGGGMPAKWYDLFLELLTQAAIESYLCDGQTGLEAICEIFSYGDVGEEEDEEEYEDEEEQEMDVWGVRAADHHLLFPKTRTMYLFNTQFLNINGSVQAHFEKLAQSFPLERFERNMGDFIQMILDTMDVPALDTNTEGPSVYKYPGDGSLLMPEVPDEDEQNKKRSASLDETDHDNKRKKQ